MYEPEGSFFKEAAPAGNWVTVVKCFEACSVTGLLCKHIDSTKSTSGAGPEQDKALLWKAEYFLKTVNKEQLPASI